MAKDDPKTAIELEADILQQEHRFIPLVTNMLGKSDYQLDDPRRAAVESAFLWRLFMGLFFPGAAFAFSLVGYYQIYLAQQANSLLKAQNEIQQKHFELASIERNAAWLEIDHLEVKPKNQFQHLLTMDLMNNSGKVCALRELDLISQFNGRLIPRTETKSSNNSQFEVVSYGETRLTASSQKYHAVLSKFRKVPDQEVVRVEVLLNEPDLDHATLVGNWHLQVRALGEGLFSEAKEIKIPVINNTGWKADMPLGIEGIVTPPKPISPDKLD